MSKIRKQIYQLDVKQNLLALCCCLAVFCLVFSLSTLMNTFKIGSLNLNGSREARKLIDFLLLQETHSDGSSATEWCREWEGEVTALLLVQESASSSPGLSFRTVLKCNMWFKEGVF